MIQGILEFSVKTLESERNHSPHYKSLSGSGGWAKWPEGGHFFPTRFYLHLNSDLKTHFFLHLNFFVKIHLFRLWKPFLYWRA